MKTEKSLLLVLQYSNFKGTTPGLREMTLDDNSHMQNGITNNRGVT